MTANILRGHDLATEIKIKVQNRIKHLTEAQNITPGLATIVVGNDPASKLYIKKKQEACAHVGIRPTDYDLPQTTDEATLIDLIQTLNFDPTIHGVLVQLPLPKHINESKIIESISPKKDVDGFHPYNIGRLVQRFPLLRPCTPLGIMKLLDVCGCNYKGMTAVVVGASNIVGRPMAAELLLAGCTVIVCHRFTSDLAHFVKQADILIAAVGKPNLIAGDWVKSGAIAIDAGITRNESGQIKGDIEFERAVHRASWITPVPGGVGPMTVACLLENTLLATELLLTNTQDS